MRTTLPFAGRSAHVIRVPFKKPSEGLGSQDEGARGLKDLRADFPATRYAELWPVSEGAP